jgi:zona occludens toxin
MGSGKSFEGVLYKMVVALKESTTRRVVTNIEGLNYEEISKFTGVELESLKNRLISVNYERVLQPGFWYSPEDGIIDSVVQPGDLVILDEIWRYYNRGMKIPEADMKFFRMHRHYVDPVSKYTCDVVFINQALRGIHSDIRDIIEVDFRCKKLKSVGLASKYRVDLYENSSRTPSHYFIRSYNPKVFPMYSSYSQKGDAKESVDKRQTVFSSPFFKFGIPAMIILAIAALWPLWKFFHPKPKEEPKAVTAVNAGTQTSASTAAQTNTIGSNFGQLDQKGWRLAAIYKVGPIPVILMVDGEGRFRTLTGPPFKEGASSDVTVSTPPPLKPNEVTPWTGPAPNYGTQQRPAVGAPTQPSNWSGGAK